MTEEQFTGIKITTCDNMGYARESISELTKRDYPKFSMMWQERLLKQCSKTEELIKYVEELEKENQATLDEFVAYKIQAYDNLREF